MASQYSHKSSILEARCPTPDPSYSHAHKNQIATPRLLQNCPSSRSVTPSPPDYLQDPLPPPDTMTSHLLSPYQSHHLVNSSPETHLSCRPKKRQSTLPSLVFTALAGQKGNPFRRAQISRWGCGCGQKDGSDQMGSRQVRSGQVRSVVRRERGWSFQYK